MHVSICVCEKVSTCVNVCGVCVENSVSVSISVVCVCKNCVCVGEREGERDYVCGQAMGLVSRCALLGPCPVALSRCTPVPAAHLGPREALSAPHALVSVLRGRFEKQSPGSWPAPQSVSCPPRSSPVLGKTLWPTPPCPRLPSPTVLPSTFTVSVSTSSWGLPGSAHLRAVTLSL